MNFVSKGCLVFRLNLFGAVAAQKIILMLSASFMAGEFSLFGLTSHRLHFERETDLAACDTEDRYPASSTNVV
jgi:hypothetical protein